MKAVLVFALVFCATVYGLVVKSQPDFKLGVGGGSYLKQAKVAPTPLLRGNLDVPSTFKTRFSNDFKQKCLDYLNSQGQTHEGRTLNFVDCTILGFPKDPVPATGHVTHDFMAGNGGLHLEVKNMFFDVMNPFLQPEEVDAVLYLNDSPGEDSHESTYSKSYTTSYSISSTVGVTLGYSEELSVSVPDVGGSKSTFSMSYSFSTTETASSSTTKTMTHSEKITIPAHSITNSSCYIQSGHLTSPFSGTLTLRDLSNVGWVFQDDYFYKPGQAWFWFYQDQQTVAGLRNFANMFGSPLSFDFDVQGNYEGVAGRSVVCEVHSCPYVSGVTTCTGLEKLSTNSTL